MNITIKAHVNADLDAVWEAWNNPEDIKQWNTASEDWHTPRAILDLREGGRFSYRMEAKDGSAGFDFSGKYRKIVRKELIEFDLDDGRPVTVRFRKRPGGVTVEETFEAESKNDADLQRHGWQSILDTFARHLHAKTTA